jgi:RHH-type transcriptional regulator, proline utilization regulon repressor / proline dehydrogenase / delta 1-pyrroline-5-carboxylate dehydrogenase
MGFESTRSLAAMSADVTMRTPPEHAVVPDFRARYAPPDEDIARHLLREAAIAPAAAARVEARTIGLVDAIRANTEGVGGIEDFLREYSLSTKEGLALMVLAEALLRVPDAATADQLIEDKLSAADWPHHKVRSSALLVTASAWALGMSARIVQAGETPETILGDLVKRLGLPPVRLATRQAMRLLGSHFVMGQTIEQALARSAAHRGERYSYDMLGEAARTREDAERYFESYALAIEAIGGRAWNAALPDRPGISVKLSALHPRFEAVSRERVLAELTPRVLVLAGMARGHNLNFTVDAEEADRLALSLDVVGRVLADASLAGWDGFGVAVQAYQKRASDVITWLSAAAEALDRRLMVRLVKGAYWDTEIKRAQERGLADYPVFTRKAMTDLCYLALVRRLLAARPRLFPQFATHNALTVASAIEEAGGVEGYEFQRLHGMGEVLYKALRAEQPAAACRIYAPVGDHRDLLAYLVRRLLENGANSSFVSMAADPNVPIAAILARPQDVIGRPDNARSRRIPLPPDLYAPQRRNSRGVEFGDREELERLLAEVHSASASAEAAPLIDGVAVAGHRRTVNSPIDGAAIGSVVEGDDALVISAMSAAQAGFARWDAMPVADRALALDRAAEAFEQHHGRLLALLQVEGGKTLDDAVAELREATDLCRYYASEARTALVPMLMPGPTGESNALHYRGRGVFVCISPWNFPLAIFTGQIAAALAAGNAVVAKPAEQTPLVAAEAVRLMHEAGIAPTALHLMPGDGRIGAMLVADARVAGVAFTGSTEVGRAINRALAAKEAAIVPLIAETGGINAMIVDATALPEQVADDVVTSSFRSAGQRCSALRVLCVQEDVADRMIAMVAGAARELRVGDPRDPATHVGPVIDAESKTRLEEWIASMRSHGRVRFCLADERALPDRGTYVAPTLIELDSVRDLRHEVFGPVLHVVRYRADELDRVLADIASTGYGLTLGIHSRIDASVERIISALPVGNVYVNRNMIGAVVGTQPFGGAGLSGTGPKAGGPNYLRRFASEQTVTINTAAAGGNTTLFTQGD